MKNSCIPYLSVLITAMAFSQSCETNPETCRAGMCVGDRISFGHYEQDHIFDNGKESIEWRVLDIKDGKALIISEKTLDVQRYNTTKSNITWDKSTICSWLNGYDASYNTAGTDFTGSNFIDAAFTAEEKAKIAPSSATTDKIFLLSITEANNYFKSNADRMADPTRYAVKKGAYVYKCTDVHCPSYWWLRSPGRSIGNASIVYDDGSVIDFGRDVNSDIVPVRPALWVNL